MTYDLTKFDLGDMLKSSLKLRETASGASTLEASAQRVCRFLYDELHGPGVEHACALVRCYKTHAFGALEADLQQFALSMLSGEAARPATPAPDMKCLTLMASVGQTAAWNSRYLSHGHRAIPLPSPEMVEKAPMISQLIKELGMEVTNVLRPSPEIVKELAGKRHGVFYVENALGNPYIPAQQEFVVPYGIKSVVGIGGMLPTTGDLFAIILFSTVHVPQKAADRFKTLALDVKSAFSRFSAANTFNEMHPATVGSQRAQ